jgi:hypothetical protein
MLLRSPRRTEYCIRPGLISHAMGSLPVHHPLHAVVPESAGPQSKTLHWSVWKLRTIMGDMWVSSFREIGTQQYQRPTEAASRNEAP